MKNVLTLSKPIRALLLSLSLVGCATLPAKQCRVQAPILNPAETVAGTMLNDDDLASLTIYIEALEKFISDAY